MLKRNTTGLKKNALKKRENAIQRAEEGIQKLLQTGSPINFGKVAEVAGVSRAWLYNQPEIRTQIEQHREIQTKKSHRSKKQKTPTSKHEDNTKASREDLLTLEAENLRLRNQIEKLGDSDLLDVIELQQNEIEQLTKQNSRLMRLLTEARTEIEGLKETR
ncbi:DUF6262 family protein [Acaryochloris sp. CCMEE 5410]|uniref:DUF6262 family protein n=1 Tax=Acaryochloris sp. CCMEE 5410 TaxID=310037 RepID=UPI00024845D4|nr:DUF6262 family protein [Acaryochloris sp. CCMEE 5410]KAI9129266.1 hypothetical protein ON05_034515 [Acaryochloris sp. CCMEE 5410]